MKFTAAQVALYKAGIEFAHVGAHSISTRAAELEFLHAAGLKDHVPGARFLWAGAGPSTDHKPVVFIDEDVPERWAEEAKLIPMAIDGVGPMVIR